MSRMYNFSVVSLQLAAHQLCSPWSILSVCVWMLVNRDLCLQAVAAEFQNESAAALAAAATRHLQEAEQAKNSGNEHW